MPRYSHCHPPQHIIPAPFCHNGIISLLEFHVNEIIQNVVFCVSLLIYKISKIVF